jgi:signal recognition particle receptor subunit beta
MYSFIKPIFNLIQISFVKVGSDSKTRSILHYYHKGTEGLIFVVDSNDPERIEEAREELHDILKFPDMQNVPIVIIANKPDLPSMSFYFSYVFFQQKK